MTTPSFNWRSSRHWCSSWPTNEDPSFRQVHLSEADHKARETRRRIEDIKDAAKLEREALEEVWNL